MRMVSSPPDATVIVLPDVFSSVQTSVDTAFCGTDDVPGLQGLVPSVQLQTVSLARREGIASVYCRPRYTISPPPFPALMANVKPSKVKSEGLDLVPGPSRTTMIRI